jgi:hypothetical protein
MTARTASAAVVTLLGLAAPACAGQDAPPPGPKTTIRIDTQWIGAAARVKPADTPVNPGNFVLRVPEATWLGEVRADARVERGSRWQLVLRPRLRGAAAMTQVGSGNAETERDARFEMTEAYLNWRLADATSVTYGLQNFQWGPAEMMSPTNRVFHEVGVFRDVLYVVRGKHLLRVNVSAGRQWSLVVLGELGATSEPSFRAEAPFRHAGQAKLEYTTQSGQAYVGATAGARGGEPPWAGGYGAVNFASGFSLYADAAMQRGSQAWYPAPTGAGSVTLEQTQRTAGTRVLALAGARYAASAKFDARLEYLRQDAGYTRDQVHAAPLAFAAEPTMQTADRWLRPGLEFLGRDLIYASVLSRDLPPSNRLDLHVRYIRSLTDGSGAGVVTAMFEAGDAVMVFGTATVSHGQTLAEFTRLAVAGGTVGLIWSW